MEAFQQGTWDTPGWAKAKEVVVALASTTNPTKLEYGEKIRLLVLAMEAATESSEWIDFLVAVSNELTQGKVTNGNEPPLSREESHKVEQEPQKEEAT